MDMPPGITPHSLNEYYAMVSTDDSYVPTNSKHSCHDQHEIITEEEVFKTLDKLRNTATGLDQLPAWFLRLGAPVLAAPIAQLFNQSIRTSIVPRQWKQACITPIPKIVLSRILENHVVRIYAAIQNPPTNLCFRDQFAFRPTGSTAAALISQQC